MHSAFQHLSSVFLQAMRAKKCKKKMEGEINEASTPRLQIQTRKRRITLYWERKIEGTYCIKLIPFTA